MPYLIVAAAAAFVAILTFFSGFGLGTLLLPAFSAFFPVEIAVGATAVVHLANNLFKLGLVGKRADRRVFLQFAAPAALGSLAGANLLALVSTAPPIAAYDLGSHRCEITPVGLVIAVLMFLFALVELSPRSAGLAFPPRFIALGGALSGFFGGLSGHQGGFRSWFLLRAGLSEAAFIATGVACAVVVDVVRIAVYGTAIFASHVALVREGGGIPLVACATAAAFAGSFAGSRLVRKMKLPWIRALVGVLLIAFALALGSGLI